MTASKEAVWSSLETQNLPIKRSALAHIDINESISETIPIYMASLVAIALPTLTSAAITFQVQPEPGAAFFNLFTEAGVEVSIPASVGGTAHVIAELRGWYAFKIRSGVAATPVNQGAARQIPVQILSDA